MTTLSSAAWMAHDVGLATTIGGTMFGREALQPALCKISDRREREQVSDIAWRRFSWINLAGHAAVAATWFFGRSLLSGRSVSPLGRRLTVAKDVLVVASLATGIGSIILGRVLGARLRGDQESEQGAAQQIGPSRNNEHGGAQQAGASRDDEQGCRKLRTAVSALGIANLVANLGVAGVTTALSMEASRSLPFSVISRRLP